MFKSLHAMRDFLEQQRRVTASALGDQPLGVASCAVLGDLIDRVRLLTDKHPVDTPITLSLLGDPGDDAIGALQTVARVLGQLAELTQEGVAVADERRRPYIEMLSLIESDGYRVDLETLTEVSDARDWSVLDGIDDPTARVQLVAEQIARAEQASIHQQRLERMDAEITEIEVDYAQRIRRLTADGRF